MTEISDRNAKVIDVYKGGLTLRQTAVKVGLSMQRVHQIIEKHAPELMRPPHDTTTLRPPD